MSTKIKKINGIEHYVEINGKKLKFPKVVKRHALDNGSEIVDPKPTRVRAELSAPVTLRSKMQQLWKEFQVKQEEANAIETLADAQDFDVSNDPSLISGYEVSHELNEELEAQISALEDESGASSDGTQVSEGEKDVEVSE